MNNSRQRQIATTESRWYGAWVLAGLAMVMTPAIMLAASGTGEGFDAVVQAIQTRYHAHVTEIPFMGLMSGIASISTHGGVHNMHIATFEDFKGDGNGSVNGDEFTKLVGERTGAGWSRMIRETSRSGNEQTLIYVRPEGKHIGMMVVDMDGHELNVVQISMNPDQLMQQVADHGHLHRHGGEDGASDASRDGPETGLEDGDGN